MKLLRSFCSFGVLTVVSLFGNVHAVPGLFFPTETKYPVYYVRQPHLVSSGPVSYRHGPSYSPKPSSYIHDTSDYEYIQKSPSSSISPYSIFSEPLSYVPSTFTYGYSGGSAYGPSSSSSKPSRGRGRRPMIMRPPMRQPEPVEEEYEEQAETPQYDQENEVSGNVEDQNDQYEEAQPQPQPQPIVQRQPAPRPVMMQMALGPRPSIMQMNPPPQIMMMSQRPQPQPQRQNRPAPRPMPQRPQQPSNEVQDEQPEDFPQEEPQNEVVQEQPRTKKPTSGSKPRSKTAGKGRKPTPIEAFFHPTYDTDFFTSSFPSFTDGLYTVNSGGGSGWGWGSSEDSSPDTESPSPAPPGSVDEVDNTEESEARRPSSTGRGQGSSSQKPASSSGRRPSSSSGQSQGQRSRPQSSSSTTGRSNRPAAATINPAGAGGQGQMQPTGGAQPQQESTPVQNQQNTGSGRSVLNEMRRPMTNEAEAVAVSEEVSPRPEYGPPAGDSSSSRGSPLGGADIVSSEGSSSSQNGGLLDADLIRTVQQIISTFDN